MKYFLIICLLLTSLLSNTTKSDQDYYEEAKVLFKNKQYQKTIDTLFKIYDNNIANINVNFYIGRSYYELKEYEKATIYFERILIANEDHLRTRVELAQSYMMLGLDNEAIQNFNIVLRNNIPNNVKENIKKQILYIEDKATKHLFTGIAGIGFTYDTNVNNITNVKTFDTPIFKNVSVTDEKISDKHAIVLLNGNYYYKINDNYTLEHKLNAIKQYFDKEKQKDLSLIAYSLYLSQFNSNSKLSYGLDIAKVTLDKKDYIDILGLTVNYQRRVIDDIYSFLSVKVLEKIYAQEKHENLDSNNYQLVLGNILPTKDFGNFTLMYLGSYESMKKDDPNSSSKSIHGILLENSYPYNTNLSLVSSIDYNIIKEKKIDPTFLIKRKDTLMNLSYGISYDLTNKLNLSSTLKYIKNNSNIDIYSYDKESVDIFLKRSF